jgi:transposase-like protein
MPQIQLPLFPVGTTAINEELAFEQRDEQVVYSNGHLLVFTHRTEDVGSFRLFTTQLIVNGTATQGQIVKAFGVPVTTVKRCCRLYRERGAAAFFKPPARRHGHRLTPERLAEAQRLLDQGQRVPQISRQLNILPSTLHKALDDGRLKLFKKRLWFRSGAEWARFHQEPTQCSGSTGGLGGGDHAFRGACVGLAGPVGGRADPF